MCGIFCCYNRQGDLASFRPRAIALSKLQRHRGTDWSGCYMAKDTVLVHERLAIVGVGECERERQCQCQNQMDR
jgi:asparagine synthase (glutamine-hydrolysing)